MNAAALEAALLRGLAEVWETENAGRFRGRLKRPVLSLADGTRLGAWIRGRREIILERGFVRERPWGVVVEVLKHEMAHQYVNEVLGVVDETAHGAAFRETCARFGIDASATGEPEPGDVDDRVVRRIQKLLALAASPNRHEAEAAMAAAQSLLLRHNLSEGAVRPGSRSTWRHLGTPALRMQQADRLLASILGTHFFVEVIWVPVWIAADGRRGQVLEICGAPENVAFADYVYQFLRGTADRLWLQVAPDRPRGGRRAFVAGVMRGFYDKLAQQAKVHASEGLVWLGDPAVKRYLRQRYPHIRQVRRQGVAPSEAFSSGRDAGRGIVLHKPVEESAPSRGRLLGKD